MQADRLLRVVEAMLQHTMLREADSLSGPYAAALNRMVNQVGPGAYSRGHPVCAHALVYVHYVLPWTHLLDSCLCGCLALETEPTLCCSLSPAYSDRPPPPPCRLQVAGSGWKLTLEGQPADAPPEEPRFATWEEVLNKQRQGQQGQQQAGVGDGGATASGGFNPASSGSVADRSFYDLLGVAPSADLPAIKAAYRQLALRLHPDVNPAPDAAQRFAAVAAAYDVLSDAAARALYDRFGPEGMQGRAGECGGWAVRCMGPKALPTAVWSASASVSGLAV